MWLLACVPERVARVARVGPGESVQHTDWMVTRLAWMAHRLVSSKRETR